MPGSGQKLRPQKMSLLKIFRQHTGSQLNPARKEVAGTIVNYCTVLLDMLSLMEYVKDAHVHNLMSLCSRRNCKGSPMCLNMMGEQGWQATLVDSHWHDIEDPELDRRTPVRLVYSDIQYNNYIGGFVCLLNAMLSMDS